MIPSYADRRGPITEAFNWARDYCTLGLSSTFVDSCKHAALHGDWSSEDVCVRAAVGVQMLGRQMSGEASALMAQPWRPSEARWLTASSASYYTGTWQISFFVVRRLEGALSLVHSETQRQF